MFWGHFKGRQKTPSPSFVLLRLQPFLSSHPSTSTTHPATNRRRAASRSGHCPACIATSRAPAAHSVLQQTAHHVQLLQHRIAGTASLHYLSSSAKESVPPKHSINPSLPTCLLFRYSKQARNEEEMKSLNLWPNFNPSSLPCSSTSPELNVLYGVPRTPSPVVRCHCSLTQHPFRCAVLGAGFAGLSVVWHLLKHSPKELHMRIDIYDEVGIGGGASGISGGLLHPYSPKVKLLWEGAQCWKESIKLLRVAEEASVSSDCKLGQATENMKAFQAHKS